MVKRRRTTRFEDTKTTAPLLHASEFPTAGTKYGIPLNLPEVIEEYCPGRVVPL